MNHREHFYNSYTTAQGRFHSPEAVRARINQDHAGFAGSVAQFLPKAKDARILDLGCGFGSFVSYLQRQGYSNVRGVDASSEQVELALSHHIPVEVGDLFEVLKQEQNVAMISMFDVIEHLTRSEAIIALQEIHRVLAPGGVVLLRTPNVDAPLGTVYSFGDLTHELHLNTYSALELFASLPFADVEILPLPPVGGSLPVRALRSLLRPAVTLCRRVLHLVQGIPYRNALLTPNMLIVARRK